ncbi:hypothetical protein DICPUDRAFT_58236 [Dictyostelium purpureum]|uniref:BTB domain-containing protein n=1 Tax=Dictyostelium purpureum TaxID=5786 RepID=F0ZZX1_DICPU|nr:uncharacterized protein DICPUDRAFT_58236 [Dictyostelium purpureum]EGC30514.1 hypothetical protein DICPUDRAFT_58236 [Dictyostelium purpureum]|eukprot:XP_003292962.1 hypothetical protein DICPUDRAFT_58236 [Dictyostelium purpureum]
MKLVTKRLRYLNNYNIESQIPPCSLGRDMLFLVNNPEYKDVTFIVEDKPVYAWKGILCARSDYFRAMFEVPLSESIKGEVQMESISHSTFLLVLQYLYTGEVLCSKLTNPPTNNSKNSVPLIEADDGTSRKPNNHHIQPINLGFDDYIQLFIAANRFMINRLKLVVETLIIKEFSIYNIYNIFKLTDIYESTFLLNEAIKFLCDNHLQIAETSMILKMQSFRKALLDILNTSLLNKAFPFLESNNINFLKDIQNTNSNSNSDSDDNTNEDNFIDEEYFNPNNYNYANNYVYASNINHDEI